jgi:uncharacterized protein YecT (DUF1311 family)
VKHTFEQAFYRKNKMKADLTLPLLLITTNILIPTLVFAGHPNPVTYTQFILAPSDKAVMAEANDKACQSQAAKTPNDLRPQVACHLAQTARFEARLQRALRVNSVRANTPRQSAFLRDQRAWAAGRSAACTAKWSAELNPNSNSFDLAVSQCVAEETYRRTLWIERNSR